VDEKPPRQTTRERGEGGARSLYTSAAAEISEKYQAIHRRGRLL
jgi:hypothetical protein